jgi:biotin operon repressor
MTIAEFDAVASAPRFRHPSFPGPQRSQCEQRIIRVAWLVARFARREFVSIERYRDRFGVSVRSFHRDMAALRDAGMYLELHPTRGYKLLYFGGEVEAG